MRRAHLLLLICSTTAVALVGCGDAGVVTTAPAAPLDGPAVAGKPRPELGQVEARILSRPGAGRAWVEATWVRGPQGTECELHLVLPEGAQVLEGEAISPLDESASTGQARWLLDFPEGRPLTLTVRLCGDTQRGTRVTECYLALVPEASAAR